MIVMVGQGNGQIGATADNDGGHHFVPLPIKSLCCLCLHFLMPPPPSFNAMMGRAKRRAARPMPLSPPPNNLMPHLLGRGA